MNQFVVLSCFIVILASKANHLELYKESSALQIVDRKDKIGADDILASEHKRSKIQCADNCMNSEDCVSFCYNKKSRECRTHGKGLDAKNGTFINGTGFMYYKLTNRRLIGDSCRDSQDCFIEHSVCGADGQCTCCPGFIYDDINKTCSLNSTFLKVPGYGIFLRQCLVLYLKFENTTKTSKHDASILCGNDGGHLLLVKGEDTYLLVRDILYTMTTANWWIDGEDFDGSRNYTSWKNDTLPYFNWGPIDPNGNGPQCIRILRKREYRFADNDCNKLYEYICQIDISKN